LRLEAADFTEKRLLDAALAAFNQNGFIRTNVEDITGRAGVGRSTFYLYFQNKNDILSHLVQDTLHKIDLLWEEKALNRWLNIKDLEKFEAPLVDYTNLLEESSGVFRALVEGMYQDKQLLALFKNLFSITAAPFAKKIENSQRKGFHKLSNPLLIAQLMAITIIFPFLLKVSGVISFSSESLAKTIAYILFSVLNHNDKRTVSFKNTGAFNKVYDKTRHSLILAAQEEFDVYGYFDAKVGRIAKRAGYNRSTFYRYFKDKEDLIQQMTGEMFSSLIPSNPGPDAILSSKNSDDLDSLVRVNLSVLALFQKYFPIQRAFIQGAFTSERLKSHYKSLMDGFGQVIQVEISDILKKNKITGYDALVVTQILQVITSFSYMLYLEGIIQSSEYEFTANLGIFLYYFFNFNPLL